MTARFALTLGLLAYFVAIVTVGLALVATFGRETAAVVGLPLVVLSCIGVMRLGDLIDERLT